MPNNMNHPNKGQGMPKRDSQGPFTNDKNRNARDRGSRDYQKGSNSGRQGSSSHSSEHMSDIGRKRGQR